MKTWFITGTSRGFGREWTKAALGRGERVAATARNIDSLRDLASAHGKNLLPIKLDVTDRAADFAVPLKENDSRARRPKPSCHCRWGDRGRRAKKRASSSSTTVHAVLLNHASPKASAYRKGPNRYWRWIALTASWSTPLPRSRF